MTSDKSGHVPTCLVNSRSNDAYRAHRQTHELARMNAIRNSRDPDDLLNEVEAADLLRLSVRTLQAWRCKGIGPRFVRIGRIIRYRRGDLTDWIATSTVCPTSATA